MIELKSCPFCGGKAEMQGSENVNGGPYYYAACSNIDCKADTRGAETKEQAAEIWNRRAEE